MRETTGLLKCLVSNKKFSDLLGINDFKLVRTTVEIFEDHLVVILADVSGMIALSGHSQLLEIVADALKTQLQHRCFSSYWDRGKSFFTGY
jgi:hypothetical protein